MKLSIITVNYNNVSGLKKTIDSVIAQTCRDFEWIVIDGGSTDGGKDLIEKYQEHFTYWCSESDKGIYNAMNKGVAHATGEYVLFLNSGDVFFNECVVEQASPYLKESDFIVGDSISHHRDGTIGPWNSPHYFTAYMIVFYSLNHQSMFISRKLLKERPYREDLKIVADWEQQLFELVFHDATYKYLPVVVSEFHEDGISQTNIDLHNRERQSVLHEYFSQRMLCAIQGENELKELINHVQENTLIYKLDLLSIKFIKKICMLLHL